MKRVLSLLLASLCLTAACDDDPAVPIEIDRPVQVTLTPGVLSLAIGEQRQLAAEVRGSHGDVIACQVTWLSSDPDVASVDSLGLVTARGIGAATISARAGESSATASASVSVIIRDPLIISVSPANITVPLGGTVQLSVNAGPGDFPITWSSAGTGAVTVSETYLLTGTARGSVVLTATSASGRKVVVLVTVT